MPSTAAVNCLGGYTHNPRGNVWLNDESTFGHKLLLKMGWNKGKGLGRNEDGIKENLKVKLKRGSSGVGWKDKSFFNVQSTEYDSILKSISEKCTPTNGSSNLNSQTKQESGSLELRSQAFRNRLHYQKFIRGKDISRYTEKDMKSIFIFNKTSKENTEEIIAEDLISPTIEDSHSEDKVSNLLNTYNSKLSIIDYFIQKVKGKKNVNLKTSNHPNLGLSKNLENESFLLDNMQSVKVKKKKDLTVTEADNYNSLNLDVSQLCRTKSSNKHRKRSEDLCNGNVNSSDRCKSSELNCGSVSEPNKKRRKTDANISVGSEVSKEDQNSKELIVKADLSPSNSIEILDDCLPINETSSIKKKRTIIIADNYNRLNLDVSQLCKTKSSNKQRKKSEDLCNGNVSSSNRCKSSELSCDSDTEPSKKRRKTDSNTFVGSEVSKEDENSKELIVEADLSPSNSIEILDDCLPINETSSIKKKRTIIIADNYNSLNLDVSLLCKTKSSNKQRKKSEDLCNGNVSSSDRCKSSELSCGSDTEPSKKRRKTDSNTFVGSEVPKKDENSKKLIVEADLSPSNSIEILDDCLHLNETSSIKKKHKKSEKHKHKLNAFENLKRSTKIKSGKYSLKNVSFNDHVSYRIIEPNNNNGQSASESKISCLSEPECITLDVENKTEFASIEDAANEIQEIGVVERKDSSKVEETSIGEQSNEQIAPADDCSLSKLPDRKSRNYNNWIESQRQAMKVYKSMLDNIRKHEIWRTSNIMSIPGYGNHEAIIADATNESQEIEVIERKDSNQVEETRIGGQSNEEVESADGCSLSKLPDIKSGNYNNWIESQRQAMKVYKSMLDNIRKHKIWRTSNIMSIPGYGNHEAIIADATNESQEIEVIERKDSNQVEETRIGGQSNEKVESADGCSLSKLPNSKSSNYNSWIESQRLAMKMDLYRNMFDNIRKHEILRTSNILSIRGYGNWGY